MGVLEVEGQCMADIKRVQCSGSVGGVGSGIEDQEVDALLEV